MEYLDNPFIFIVGSPRSGTTILGEILDRHPDVRQWYEPYFIWDRHFLLAEDDERKKKDATPVITHYIRNHFNRYQRNSKFSYVVDKSPRNSLKIPFIREIFPNAHFLHIIRDGRDATLSINREWHKRMNIIEGSAGSAGFQTGKALQVIRKWLSRQPFLSDRIRALWYETHGYFWDKSRHTNRVRWNGEIGWGPRFEGWEKQLAEMSLLQFNALQWENCVRASIHGMSAIDSTRKLSINYENFVQEPERVLTKITEFIGIKNNSAFLDNLPVIKKGNFYKWQKAFSGEEIEEIKPILTPMLDELGYLDKWPW